MFKIEDHSFSSLPDQKSIVIDIGANIGLFSSRVLTDFGCRVIAYEPMKHLCEQYLEPIKKSHPRFTYHNKGVWSANGTMEFVNFGKEWVNKSAPNPWGAGTLLGVCGNRADTDCFGNKLTKETIEVETISIDDVLRDFDIVDLLKMDCEGAEIEILNKVSNENLCKCQQLSVEFHAWIGRTYTPAITMQDVNNVIGRMNSLGYRYIIEGNHPDILFFKGIDS